MSLHCTLAKGVKTDEPFLANVPLTYMNKSSLYSPALWSNFLKKTSKNKNKLKTYPQFDHIFDFTQFSEKIKNLVEDPTLRKIATHPFLPHVKILTKTPRYRYDDSLKDYCLDTKIRPISFCSHFDSYIYSFYAFALTQHYEQYIRTNSFHECVLAYRSDLNGDCNIQFAKRAFDSVKSMSTTHGKCSAIALDITGYFDNIDHKKLKENWCEILGQNELPLDQFQLYKSLTNYSYVNKDSILKHFKIDLAKHNKWRTLLDLIPDEIAGSSFKEKFVLLRKRKLIVTNRPKIDNTGSITYRGIPQGSPMSSVLSNIYLIHFDKWLYNLGATLGFSYFRYCDDILIVCKSEDSKALNNTIIDEIKNKYNLTIQDKKTEVIEFRKNHKGILRGFNNKGFLKPTLLSNKNEENIYKNLQYLGFEYNGQSIYLRPGSLSRYFRKAKRRILKTMMMVYGKKSKSDKIHKKQLYERYTHFGERNFVTYAQNAARKNYKNSAGVEREGLNSLSIKRQIAAHFSILEKETKKKSSQFAINKGKKHKS